MISVLFPEGQRKLIVSLIALAVGIVMEKLGGGLTDNMQESIVAIVAIFTGGNVMEHLANALKVFKGTKIGKVIEDVIPGDQGLAEEPVVTETEADAKIEQEVAQPVQVDLVPHVNSLYAQVKELQEVNNVNAKNIQTIIKMMGSSATPRTPTEE